MTDHLINLEDLPEWGPDVPGTPVEATYPGDSSELRYAWRDGMAVFANPGRYRRTSPFPWGRVRITAVLADDPTHWVPVGAGERVGLGEHLVGARVWSERDGAPIVGPVVRVDDDGWLWGEEGHLLGAPHHNLRVHPADLARAREAAVPKPPTCWDEWESGDVWAWGGLVYRMGDDRVLRLATHHGTWVDAEPQPGGVWVTTTLTAPTDEDMARVAAADEAGRLPEEPLLGSFVLDRNENEWFRTVDGWVRARSGWCWEWAKLNERCGPVTVSEWPDITAPEPEPEAEPDPRESLPDDTPVGHRWVVAWHDAQLFKPNGPDQFVQWVRVNHRWRSWRSWRESQLSDARPATVGDLRRRGVPVSEWPDITAPEPEPEQLEAEAASALRAIREELAKVAVGYVEEGADARSAFREAMHVVDTEARRRGLDLGVATA